MSLQQMQFEYDFHKHYNLKIKKSAYTGKGLCGLINLGNKCFLNSILQCLFSTMSLTDYILSTQYLEDLTIENRRTKEHYLLMSYVTLVNNVYDLNQLIKPKTFVENLSMFHRKYFSMNQQDSHECLLYILDILHKSISYPIEVDIQGDPASSEEILMKKSLESWRYFYENSYSFLIQTFNGSTISNVECSHCRNNTVTFEPYNTLSLDIPLDDTDLYSCLEEYFQKDEKISSYTCEKCERKGCNKIVDLWTVPNYLIIHLKRFKEVSNQSVKNTAQVQYPIKDLDITRFISKEKKDTNNYIYDLYAINHHSGNMDSGHYWSSCKNLDGHWYQFNDANVSRYNLDSSLVTSDAYILFYARKFILKPIQI